MVRLFTKSLFVMMLSIMLGAVIITYFVADIARRTEVEVLTTEIQVIESKNINFTNHFLKSSVLLDKAREDRAFGDYHFDIAFLWYNSALKELDEETLNDYKNRTIENSTNAMPNYKNSHNNFGEARDSFNNTKTYTNYPKYMEVLDLYINLTESGGRLTTLRYTASQYLIYLTENLTIIEGNVTYISNVSSLRGFFEEVLEQIAGETKKYDEIKDELDEYEFFDEIR